MTVEDDRFDYGEERSVTFGLLQGRVVAVVHTESQDYRAVPKLVKYGQPFADETCESENVPHLAENRYILIISARKATKYEQKTYFEQI